MTKRSAISVAMALVASILVAAVALSMNFEIGTPASANDAPVKVEKSAKDKGPIVKRRTITVHRTKPARTIGGGTVTVASSSGGSVSTRSASSGSFSDDDSYEHESEHEAEHEVEHEVEHESGDDD